MFSYNNFTNLYQKHAWFGLRCIFQYFQQTVIFQSKKSIKFSFRLTKDEIFNHGQYGLTYIVHSKKNYQTAFEQRCTSQNFYPETLLLNHITLWSISYKLLRKYLIFFLFLSAVFFYSIYTILNKFESGTIRVDPHSYF